MSIILMKSFLDTRYPWSPPEHNGKKEQSKNKKQVRTKSRSTDGPLVWPTTELSNAATSFKWLGMPASHCTSEHQTATSTLLDRLSLPRRPISKGPSRGERERETSVVLPCYVLERSHRMISETTAYRVSHRWAQSKLTIIMLALRNLATLAYTGIVYQNMILGRPSRIGSN